MILPPLSHTNFKRNYTFETSLGKGLLIRNNNFPNRVYLFPTAFKDRITATMLAKMDAVCEQRERDHQSTTLVVKESTFNPIFSVKPSREEVSTLLNRVHQAQECALYGNDPTSLNSLLREAIARQDKDAAEDLLSRGACESCLLDYLNDLPNYGDPELYITTFVNLFPLLEARGGDDFDFKAMIEACPWKQIFKDQHFDKLATLHLDYAKNDLKKFNKFSGFIRDILDPTNISFRHASPLFLKEVTHLSATVHLYPEICDVTLQFSESHYFATNSTLLKTFSTFFNQALQFNEDNGRPQVFDFSDKEAYPAAMEEAVMLSHGIVQDFSSDFVTQFYLAQALDFLGIKNDNPLFTSGEEILIAQRLLFSDEDRLFEFFNTTTPEAKLSIVSWAFQEAGMDAPSDDRKRVISSKRSKLTAILKQFKWLREIHTSLDDISAFNGVIENIKNNYFSTSDLKLVEARLDSVMKNLEKDHPHLVDTYIQDGDRRWGTNQALLNYRVSRFTTLPSASLSSMRFLLNPDYAVTTFRQKLLQDIELSKIGRQSSLIPSAEIEVLEALLKEDGLGVIPLLSEDTEENQFLRHRVLKTWIAKLIEDDNHELIRLKELMIHFSKQWDLRWYRNIYPLSDLTPVEHATYLEIHGIFGTDPLLELVACIGDKATMTSRYYNLSVNELQFFVNVIYDFPYSLLAEMLSQMIKSNVKKHLGSKLEESKTFLNAFKLLAPKLKVVDFRSCTQQNVYNYFFKHCVNVKKVVIEECFYVFWKGIARQAFKGKRLEELVLWTYQPLLKVDIPFVNCLTIKRHSAIPENLLVTPKVKILSEERNEVLTIERLNSSLFRYSELFKDLKDVEVQGFILSNFPFSFPQKYSATFRECDFTLFPGFVRLRTQKNLPKEEVRIIDCKNFQLTHSNTFKIALLTVIRSPIADWPSIMRYVDKVVIDHTPDMPEDEWDRFKDRIFVNRALSFTD